MALPTLDGSGTISTDVRRGLTKSQKKWAGATVRFASRRKNADDTWVDDTVIFVSVVGFDQAAEQLAGFAKGDTIAVVGKIKALGIWKPERGEPRPSLEMFVERVEPPPSRHSKGSSEVSTPVGTSPTQPPTDLAAAASVAGETHAAAGPADLDAYRRESGERLRRQHAGNANRTGRLA